MATVSELLKEIVPPIFCVPSLTVNEAEVIEEVSIVFENVADTDELNNISIAPFAGVVDVTSGLVPVGNDQV